MSSSTWVNYGYGVCLRKLEFNSVERIQELLSHAPGFRNSIYETFRKCGIENPTLDDYLEADHDFDNGMAYLLQGVIEEAENFQLTACDDYEGDRYLIFQAISLRSDTAIMLLQVHHGKCLIKKRHLSEHMQSS